MGEKSLDWREKRSWRSYLGMGIGLVGVAIATALARQPGQLVTPSLDHGPLKDPNALRLFAIGDTGVGGESQRQVARALESLCAVQSPDAVLLLGDQFYFEGVSGVDDAQWQEKFTGMYDSPCLKDLPFYATLGNHDYRGDVGAQLAYSKKATSPQWVLPERTYVVRFGSLLKLGVADTNMPDRCYTVLCSLDRLLSELRSAEASWTVVAGHHPLFSGGRYRREKAIKSFFFAPFLCSSSPDFYLAGHDHNLQSLVGDDGDLPCPLHEIISGGGGADLYEASSIEGLSEFVANEHGFVSLLFTHRVARYEFWGLRQSDESGSEGLPEQLYVGEKIHGQNPFPADEPH